MNTESLYKLANAMFTEGTHTVGNVTFVTNVCEWTGTKVYGYVDGELFFYSPGGMMVATRATNGSTVKLKNALNKVFQVLEFPIVWTVEDGTLCFTPQGQAFSNTHELEPDTTYAYNLVCNFYYWDRPDVEHNARLSEHLKSTQRYL